MKKEAAAGVDIINLPLLGLKNDPFGAIPSIPVGPPYLAAYLREKGFDTHIIDAFGLDTKKTRILKDKYVAYGLYPEEIVDRIGKNTKFVLISTHSGASYTLTKEIISEIKKRNLKVWIIVGGNFATTLPNEFISMGADFVVLGEGELASESLLKALSKKVDYKKIEKIDGLVYKDRNQPKTRFIQDLDSLPFPAIDLLPMENYWALGYSHGPFEGNYTFLITSRGCPFNCRFCATPYIWQRKWRARSVKNAVDEIEYMHKRFGIVDFHIQDDNFTVNKDRVKEFCYELMKRKLPVTWQVLSTKAETVDEELLILMKKAGCDYLSVSPETGSKAVLEKMNKPFDYEHMVDIVKLSNKLGIKMQACFVLGFPGETDKDRKLTEKYIARLARAGLDETGLFIMTPLPGAYSYDHFKWDFTDYEELCFSPRWRKDYNMLNRWRMKLFFILLFNKLLFHPLKMVEHLVNLMSGKFKTKIEMGIYRTIKTWQK